MGIRFTIRHEEARQQSIASFLLLDLNSTDGIQLDQQAESTSQGSFCTTTPRCSLLVLIPGHRPPCVVCRRSRKARSGSSTSRTHVQLLSLLTALCASCCWTATTSQGVRVTSCFLHNERNNSLQCSTSIIPRPFSTCHALLIVHCSLVGRIYCSEFEDWRFGNCFGVWRT